MIRLLTIRLALGSAWLGCFLALLAWSFWPVPIARQVIPLIPAPQPPGASTPISLPFPQGWSAVVELPRALRLGEAGLVHLSVQASEAAAGEEAAFSTHNLVTEARLDLAGIPARPAGEVVEPLRPGRQTDFYWSLPSTRPGTFEGTLWLYLRWAPIDPAAPQPGRLPALALPLHLRAEALAGMTVLEARILGGLGLLAVGGWWLVVRRNRVVR